MLQLMSFSKVRDPICFIVGVYGWYHERGAEIYVFFISWF
jgi:hypothetical protein